MFAQAARFYQLNIAQSLQRSEVPVVTFLQQAPLGISDYFDSTLQAFESFSSVLIRAVMEKHLNVSICSEFRHVPSDETAVEFSASFSI